MAGRIPQSFIDELLARTDIVDVIDSYVPLKKSGADYMACCPFHDEKTPSFSVSQRKQFYHCFGCGANGSAITFLMEHDHLAFPEAIEKLAGMAGLDVPREGGKAPINASKKTGVDLYGLMGKCAEFYQQQLRSHPDKRLAVDYLQRRGLDGHTAKHFGIGFAPEGWELLHKAIAKDSKTTKALATAGMLTERSNSGGYYDRFRERIMFPIVDHRGRICAFGGRIFSKSDSKPGQPKYLNSPETPIFHKRSELYGLYQSKEAIRDADHAIIVEGYMDVIALYQAGVKNAVATLGTATTSNHLQRLFRHTEKIVFCFDGDRAGKAAAWKALETALPVLKDGIQLSFLFLPDGEDPDSMVQKIGSAAFKAMVTNAVPLADFIIEKLSSETDLARLDGKAKLAQNAKTLLATMGAPILQQLISEQIAKISHADVNTIATQANAASSPSGNHGPKSMRQHNNSSKPKIAPLSPMRKAVSLIVQYPEIARDNSIDELRGFKLPGLDLLVKIHDWSEQQESLSTATIIERFRNTDDAETVEKLATYTHMEQTGEQRSRLYSSLLQKIHEQARDVRYEQLSSKPLSELSSEDRRELQSLVANKAN